MDNFDGLGHFRTKVATGDFIDTVNGHARTTLVDFNHDSLTYTGLPGQNYLPLTAGESWILDTFRETSTTEAVVGYPSGSTTQVAKEESCFDSRGFMTRHRRLLRDTGARDAHDIVFVQTDDGSGNVVLEQWFGGDRQTVATNQHVCDISVPAPTATQYQVTHAYDFGSRKASQWKDASGGATGSLGFLSLDRTIDGRTGLVRSSRDVSVLETVFDYDNTGRLVEIHSPNAATAPSEPAAWETYSYAIASAGAGATVKHRSFPNGASSGTPLREEQWVYDGLGRIHRERKLGKNNTFDDRFTFYDGSGHRQYQSEWGQGDETGHYLLEWGDFDPFDRPTRISRYSNGAFLRDEAALSYLGERKATRTQWIATSAPGGTPTTQAVDRVEWFDDHGRLQSVNEFSGGAAVVWTDYEYDAGNRLRRSRTPISDVPNPATQDRWWLFDQRGFLVREQVPEKGASGNGSVFYQEYDPLGNSWNRVDGAEVGSTFDRAGRLTEVDEVIRRSGLPTIYRPIKKFTFAASNTGSDYALGKLTTAVGYNWVVVGGISGFDVRFQEAFRYQGTGGARSERTVVLKFGAFPLALPSDWQPPADQPSFDIFVHKEASNALGLRSVVTYPQCVLGTFQCPSSQPVRTVQTTYTNGFLATVSDSSTTWVSSTTFHHSGLWKTMGRGNGVIETQLQDETAIARPRSIEAKLGATSLWRTGEHQYDPSGNLDRLVGTDEGGNDVFFYDKVSRLKEARIQVPPATNSGLGPLLFADSFEDGTSQRWIEAWPPTGWSPGTKTQSFTFDRFGNLTQITTTGQPSVDLPITAATNRLDSSLATYDSSGNLLTLSTDGAVNTFDPLNRQWKRLSPDGAGDYYLYTADDERILTFSPNTASSWHWALRDFSGKVLRKYELAVPDAPQASYDVAAQDYILAGERVLGTQAPLNPTDSTMFATVDHLGTPRLWTDKTGNVIRKLKYYPFGKEATPSDQWNVALQFTGHERDNHDLSLPSDDGDYMHARFHSPLTGRMLSVDPVGGSPGAPQSWNRYAYVQGNPLKYTDPTGRLIAEIKKYFSNLFNQLFPPQAPQPMQNIEALEGEVGPTGSQFDQTATESKVQGELNEFGANAATGAAVAGAVIATEGAGSLVEGVASSAFGAVRLRRSLASAEQMGEAGVAIAGPGSRAILRDAERLASQYGGKAGDWVKKSSSTYRGTDGVAIETHWYENLSTGQRIEAKTKIFN